MKRTGKRERIIRRGDEGTASRPSFLSRAVFLSLIVLALNVSFATASGCRSFFVKDFEHGRYFDGRDATSDWERARMERLDEGDDLENEGDVRILQAKTNVSDDDAYTTRGAIKEVASNNDETDASKKSWTSKVKDSFRIPFVGKTSKEDEYKSELEPSSEERLREKERVDKLSRERDATLAGSVSPASIEKEGVEHRPANSGFWTKIFPSKNAKNVEDELIVGRAVEQKTVPRSRQKAAVVVPPLTVKTTRQKPWDRRGLVVEQYDQERFIPPMKMIESYYSTQSVAVDRRAFVHIDSYAYGDAATRDVSDSFAARRANALKTRKPRKPEKLDVQPETSDAQPEKTDAQSEKSYRSSSYSPSKNDNESSEELPEAPSKRGPGYLDGRAGSASLTPISPNGASASTNRIIQTSGLVRSKNFGQTRPISGVASTSFTERRPQPDSVGAPGASSESFIRDPQTPPSIPKATNTNAAAQQRGSTSQSASPRRDVDDRFRKSLGSQTSFDWFDPEQRLDGQYLRDSIREDFATNERVNRRSPSDLSYDATSLSDYQNTENVPVLNETQPSGSTNKGANFDGYAESHAADAFFDESSEETSEETDSDEIDLDVIVDDVIANAEYDEPDRRVFSSSTISGGEIASNLANAIMQSVETDDALENKASVLSEKAPNSLDARKVETSMAAPLTREEIAWIEQIKNAIRSLLVEREEHKRRGDDVRICDARLRLLYLVIGEYERSIQEIEDESDPLRVFWEKECRGLETLLQNQLEEIDPTFVAERLRSGLDSLSGLCQLRIRKTLLVEAPACYGLFEERLEPYEAGEPLYAYAELDYVTSRETENGFSIDVECRWRLLDAKGSPITPFETQRCRNLSETKLRDVVLNVSVPLSEELEPGVYLLELEVSDLNASKPQTCVQRLTARVVGAGVESDSYDTVATY